MKTTFGKRLKQARTEAGMTQKALAAKAGIKQATISELESDKYHGSAFAAQLAASLGVNALWLSTGKGNPKHTPENGGGAISAQNVGMLVESGARGRDSIPAQKPSGYANVSGAPVGHREIPIVSYVQAGMMTEALDPFSLGDGFETIVVDIECSENTFALRIKGKSMLPRFEEDDVIVVDPNQAPEPGSFVVAKNTDDEATFKKYRALGVNEHGNPVFELVPLNDDFATLHSERDHLHIIGVAIEHRKPLLK